MCSVAMAAIEPRQCVFCAAKVEDGGGVLVVM